MANTKTNLPKGTTGVKFSGGVLAIFLFPFWAVPFVVFTLGIATPWVICIVMRWICSNTTKDGKQFRFKGTGGGLFGRFIVWWLLSIITLGIYSFWSTRNQIRWVVENIDILEEEIDASSSANKESSPIKKEPSIIVFHASHTVVKETNLNDSLCVTPKTYRTLKIGEKVIVQNIIDRSMDLGGTWALVATEKKEEGWCLFDGLSKI